MSFLSKHDIKAVFFDFYGTLAGVRTLPYPLDWQPLADRFQEYGASYTVRELEHRFCMLESCQNIRREKDYSQIFTALLLEKGVVQTGEELAAYYRTLCTVQPVFAYDGTKEVLTHLRSLGIKTALVSNAQTCFTLKELRQAGFEGYFDHIFISSCYELRKPHKEFFLNALSGTKSFPHQVLMVGNENLADIQTPHEMGMKTAYLQSALSTNDLPKDGECDLLYLALPNGQPDWASLSTALFDDLRQLQAKTEKR